jgi:hypothetical protein
VPVLALADVPDADGETINDRTRFLYGRLVSGVREENIVGNENENEIVRVPTITITEIV